MMNEVKSPKKPLIFYYTVAMLVLLLFNMLAMPWLQERQIREAGEEFEGGSLQPMVCAQKAAELTRERVYELIAVLDPE